MLIGLVICVNYSQFFSQTYSNNLVFFDQLYVVTSSQDTATQQLCKSNKKIKLLITDSFFEEDAPFNKSKGINFALKQILNVETSAWILIHDADILIPESFKNLNIEQLDKENIYSMFRKIEYRENNKTKTDITTNLTSSVQGFVIGYFQLFHTYSSYFKDFYDESFKTASGSDIIFASQWPTIRNVFLNDTVIHIGQPGVNWFGITDNKQDITTLQNAKKRLLTLIIYKRQQNFKLKNLKKTYTKYKNINVHLKQLISENTKYKTMNKNIKQLLLQVNKKAEETCKKRLFSLNDQIKKTTERINTNIIKLEQDIKTLNIDILNEEKKTVNITTEIVCLLEELKNNLH